MIPPVLTSQIRRGVEDFLQPTFPPSNRFLPRLAGPAERKETWWPLMMPTALPRSASVQSCPRFLRAWVMVSVFIRSEANADSLGARGRSPEPVAGPPAL